MRFDPQANFVSNAKMIADPHPPGMSVRSPLKTALVILAIGFVGGVAVWLWSEGLPGQQKAAADTPSNAGIGESVVQYAEAVINGKTESEKLAAVTGAPVETETGRLVTRRNPRSLVHQEFEEGQSLLSVGRYAEAAEHFKEAIRLDPDYADAHYRLGLAYVRMGDKRSARRQRAKLEKLDTELANLLAHLVAH